MPRPARLVDVEIEFSGPYYPSAPDLPPRGLQGTIKRGSNVWRDPGGKIRVANGLLETSSTAVGARIFAADTQRAVIEGVLDGDRLPYAGLLRHDNAAIFFVSEDADAQVFIDETPPSGFTTSSDPGHLRVAIPDGAGGWDVFDAGFEKPLLLSAAVSTVNNAGLKNMSGAIGLAIAPWRSKTNAIGPPSDTFYQSLTAASASFVRVELPTEVTGQDGWILCGTRWNDQSGEIREVRRVFLQPRGTFTATDTSATLSAGDGTAWTFDLQRGDLIVIDGGAYGVLSVESDTSCTIGPAFSGVTGSGKTMTITDAAGDWYDSELGPLVPRDIIRPPRCAGVGTFGGRVFVWGCFGESEDSVTGPVILPTAEFNPEHCLIRGIRTASGGDLVNVLGGDGPLYLMTTRGLEVVSFTGNPDIPFIPKVIATPGFKATSNGILYTDTYYGFNRRPLRTRADENIDVQFAAPVWSDMEDWNAERVVLAIDPVNQAVLYIHDDGSQTTVIPFMTQQEQWGPPLYFDNRILDAEEVNGELYVTLFDGADTKVNQWEGGSGIGGEMYIASQFYDPNYLLSSRLKGAIATGKVDSLSIYAITPGAPIPDVTDLGDAAVTFGLSDSDVREPAEWTNIAGDAFAYRVDFASADGHLDKITSFGLPHSERR